MIVFLLLCGVLFHLTNPQVPSGKIIGGVNTDIKDFPSYASIVLIKPEGNEVICGGVYIFELWVLTAAHCLIGPQVVMKLLDPKNVLVRMGMTTLNDAFQGRQPKKLFKHENYPQHAKTTNDIGLIKLGTGFELGDGVALATMVNTSKFSNKLVVVGFGNVSPNTTGNLTETMHLQKVDLEAREVYRGYIECYDPTPRGACFGDSGGPLYVRENKMLVGIVASGKCDKGLGIYVNVYAYRKWISGIINGAFPIHGSCTNCVVYSLLLSHLIVFLLDT